MPAGYLFLLVNLAVFLDTVLYGIIVPIMPYYATGAGASTTEVGLIFAALSAGLLLASVPAGLACDRYGYRPVMVLGMAGLTATTLLFLISHSVWLMIISRLLQGAAAAATWSAGLALVAVLYPPQLRGQKMGLVMATTGAGTIVGPVLGGTLYQFAGYAFPFLLMAGAGALLTLLLWLSPLPGNNPSPGRENMPWKQFLLDRNIFWGVLVTAAGSFGFGILEPLLPIDLYHRFGLGSAGVGMLFGALSLSYTLFQPLFGVLSDRLGRKPIIIAGLLTTAVTIPWLALAPSLKMVAATMVLLGLTTGACSTPTLPLLAESMDRACSSQAAGKRIARPHLYGTTYGIANTAYSAGMLLGPLVGSFLVQHRDLLTALLSYSVLLVATATGTLLQLQETLKAGKIPSRS
ncbi:Predicted arabinose efflux permease, MFS family [Desulfofundulus australicus DSM 11792]|uniref:Predicted arabinose efflux permease, MFS family n=1 Tax=Desulfofundulus australicus DSM 11792 TaxID=1121425 RepID=A0A1M4ZS72_9FIRM|nr:MFS transporter [Desulfofundulus australicus]SHF20612.1 Predicted arabinose efflux permease, MFS family [Desulfofundulus australicus DSM 11792]